MTIVFIGLASIVLSLLMLWVVGKFVAIRSANVDVEASLRELLIARAEGHIDQDEFERQQASLHAALLQSPQKHSLLAERPYLLWILPLLMVAVVGGIYWGIGSSKDTPKLASFEEMSKLPGTENKPQANSGGDLNTAVKRLAEKMANDPGNGDGWLLLAKTYGELRKYAEAAEAYEKAVALLPPDATVLADWADAYIMAKDRKWDAEGRKIVKRALSADPKHVKALALAGSESFDRGDYKAAIEFWKRMKSVAAADSMDGKLADANIAEANAMLSGKKPSSPSEQVAASIRGVITVNSKMSSKVLADDTIFVVAKAPDGVGAPLAVRRYKGADLPIQFELDDNAAIMPGRTVSQFKEVQLSAKSSKAGDAAAQQGDIFVAPIKAKVGASGLKLELNTER